MRGDRRAANYMADGGQSNLVPRAIRGRSSRPMKIRRDLDASFQSLRGCQANGVVDASLRNKAQLRKFTAKKHKMFISSMAKRAHGDTESPFGVRPLPSKGTRKRNPDEDFILRGRRTPMRLKETNYRTNSEMTISRDGTIQSRHRTPSRQSISYEDFQVADEDFDPSELALNLTEFDEGPEEELVRLMDKNEASNAFLNSSANSDWFLNPVHLAEKPPVDVEKLSRVRPLAASVLKSNAQGNITSDSSENIKKTSVDSFDMSLFRSAEERMLSSRVLSGFATPYQEELASLKIERLKLEEQRLIQRKCYDELERIRGPKPRWYELKTPDFCQEAKRNNDVLSLHGHYNEIMEYRNSLLDTLNETTVKDNRFR